MKTLIADDRHRVQIPAAKPGQVCAYEGHGGVVTLTPVRKADPEVRFPRGSLAYLCTPERDAEVTAIAKATVVGVPKDLRRAAGDK
jgi:hypothetical protein